MRHRNDGLRKRCGCSRRTWAKCKHPWHFNYRPEQGPSAGETFRLSLERLVTRIVKHADGTWIRDRASLGAPITSKTDAERERDRLRTAISEGTLQQPARADAPVRERRTLRQLFDTYNAQYLAVRRPDTAKNTAYQIGRIQRTPVSRARRRPRAASPLKSRASDRPRSPLQIAAPRDRYAESRAGSTCQSLFTAFSSWSVRRARHTANLQ
jgi:hypothetical protein